MKDWGVEERRGEELKREGIIAAAAAAVTGDLSPGKKEKYISNKDK